MASMANLLMYSRGQEGFAPNQCRDLHSFPLECAPSALCFGENIHLCFARPPNFPQHLTTKQEEWIWKRKKENREVQWSTCLPVPALLHVCNRKSTETASILMLICFDIFLSLCQPYKNSVGTNLIDLKLICVATEFKICPPSFKGSADGFRVLNVAWNWDQLRKSVSFQSICCHNVKNSTS